MTRLLASIPAIFLSMMAHANTHVEVFTDLGSFFVELYDETPATKDNFLQHANSEFYDNLLFHRVIDHFMIQSGGIETTLGRREPLVKELQNESSPERKNLRGTIAMARFSDPNSATSQWFVNVKDNPHLDAKADQPGFTVFGEVSCGMNIVDAIAKEPTIQYKQFEALPKLPVRVILIEPVGVDSYDRSQCKRK